MINALKPLVLSVMLFQIIVHSYADSDESSSHTEYFERRMPPALKVERVLYNLWLRLNSKIASNQPEKFNDFEMWILKFLLAEKLDQKISSTNQRDFWLSRQG